MSGLPIIRGSIKGFGLRSGGRAFGGRDTCGDNEFVV